MSADAPVLDGENRHPCLSEWKLRKSDAPESPVEGAAMKTYEDIVDQESKGRNLE